MKNSKKLGKSLKDLFTTRKFLENVPYQESYFI